MPIAALYKMAEKDQIKPYYYGLRLQQIPKGDELNKYHPATDIVVVGYPNGLWDDVNNLPIFRKGILATSPSVMYKNTQEFLIDCAIYPGSSGSPVLSVETLSIRTPWTFLSVKLLGIVYATYQHNAQGDLSIINIPTSINTPVPNHLGLVINSIRIHELNNIISDYYSEGDSSEIHYALGFKPKPDQ